MKPNPYVFRLSVALLVAWMALAIGARSAQLVQYWPLNDGGGDSATNGVAGGNAAQLVNADPPSAWFADGPAQLSGPVRSILLDGTDDYLNLGNVGLNGSASVSFWIKPSNFDAGDVRLFSQVPFVSSYGGVARVDPFVTGNIQVIGTTGGWLSLGPADDLLGGGWTHMVFTYDEGAARVWLNGVLQSGLAGVGFEFDQADFGLGARFDVGGAIGGPFGNPYVGLVDDISFWDGPISSATVAELASGAVPTSITDLPEVPLPAELVQYFPFDDAAGSTATNGVAGGNTGTLVDVGWATSGLPSALGYSSAAVSFELVDHYVNLGNLGLNGDATVSLWINPSTLSPGDIRLFTHVTTPADFSGITTLGLLPSGVIGGGNVAVYTGGWQQVAESGTIVENVWIHLAFVFSRGRCTLYANGVPQLTASSGFAFDVAEMALGGRFDLDGTLGGPYGAIYAGLMDDVSIWNRGLQPSSVIKLAQGQKPTDITDSPETEPPFIFQDPADVDVVATFPATLSVVAAGAPTLAYQWRFGGAPIPDATDRNFTLESATVADDGDYTVVVANAFGSVTSQAARVTVDPGLPAITTQPVDQTKRVGGPASFTVVATGAQPLIYQWLFDGSPITDATNATYSIASVSEGDGGEYSVHVSNSAGELTSEVATLTLALTPAGVNINLAANATTSIYTGTAAAPDPGTVWNHVLNANLAAAPNREIALVDSDGAASALLFYSGSFPDVLAGFVAENGGGNELQRSYWHVGAGVVTPEFGFRNLDPAKTYDVYVYGIAQDFGTGFTEQYNQVGGPSKLLDMTPDTGFPVVNQDFVLFSDITGVSEVMFNAGLLEGSTVFSTVTGLQIIPASETPSFLVQPVDTIGRLGQSATFTVEAMGPEPISFQWYYNAVLIAGAESASLTINPVGASDVGEYHVVASNAAGATVSRVVRLTLQTNPPAVNVNLTPSPGAVEYVGMGVAIDSGVLWNNISEEELSLLGNREAALVNSDGDPTNIRFFSGSFGAPGSQWFAGNGGGNNLQASYWHRGAATVTPEFGFRGLDPTKNYRVFVFGIGGDFGTGFTQQYNLVGGASVPVDPVPDTGFPVEGEDYAAFTGIFGVTELSFTASRVGGSTVFSTVTGLQLQEVPAVLTIVRVGDQVTVSWTGAGTLQQADTATGIWNDIPGAMSPYTVMASSPMKYFQVRQ